jgi:hypothetical protein
MNQAILKRGSNIIIDTNGSQSRSHSNNCYWSVSVSMCGSGNYSVSWNQIRRGCTTLSGSWSKSKNRARSVSKGGALSRSGSWSRSKSGTNSL